MLLSAPLFQSPPLPLTLSISLFFCLSLSLHLHVRRLVSLALCLPLLLPLPRTLPLPLLCALDPGSVSDLSLPPAASAFSFTALLLPLLLLLTFTCCPLYLRLPSASVFLLLCPYLRLYLCHCLWPLFICPCIFATASSPSFVSVPVSVPAVSLSLLSPLSLPRTTPLPPEPWLYLGEADDDVKGTVKINFGGEDTIEMSEYDIAVLAHVPTSDVSPIPSFFTDQTMQFAQLVQLHEDDSNTTIECANGVSLPFALYFGAYIDTSNSQQAKGLVRTFSFYSFSIIDAPPPSQPLTP